MRPEQAVHECDAVLLGELRDLVEHLEAEPVTGERRAIGALDDLAAARGRQEVADDRDDAGIGAGVRDQLAAGDRGRRVEQVNPEEVLAQRARISSAQIADRQARRDGRDDRIRIAHLIDQRDHAALGRDVLGNGLEDQVGAGEHRREIVLVRSGRKHVRPDAALRQLVRPRDARSCFVGSASE